ncbi:MAG: hypothetical protein J6Y78_15655 [Paludibacteraceae bacterium]|nr:hypothetical protein [Paludibacteraceae bacterium]
MKFEIGDCVRIVEGFYNNRYSGDPGINKDMKQMEGQEHIINYCSTQGKREIYTFKDGNWSWDVGWLELAHNFDDVEEDEFMSVFENG